MAEDRQDHAAGSEPGRLGESPNGRAADGSAHTADQDAERWRGGGIGGLFGSAVVEYPEPDSVAPLPRELAPQPQPDSPRSQEPPQFAEQPGSGERPRSGERPGAADLPGTAGQPGAAEQPAGRQQPLQPPPGRPAPGPAGPGGAAGPSVAASPNAAASSGVAARPNVAAGAGLTAGPDPVAGPSVQTGPQPQPAAGPTVADTDPDGLRADDRQARRRRRAGGPAADWSAGGRGTHARSMARESPRDPATLTITAEPSDGPVPLLLPPRRRAPAPGWRRTVYQASGGVIRVPASSAQARRRDMSSRARTPVAAGHYRIAVLSLKGGVGKTTTAVGLGSTLASVRGDRVIAIDANTDRGTLADKITPQTAATIRDLLDEKARIRRYADVRGFTSQAASRLEVLASAQDPGVSKPFSETDYCDVCTVLERFYSVCVTDCGTGLMHSAMSGVLRMADQVVLVTTASVDGARSASACMDWLTAHGHQDLVRNGVVVVSAVPRRGRSAVDLDLLEDHFAARCRAVTVVPYDAYLAQGAEVELDQLRKSTADAYLELAAVVGDGFARRREPRAIPAGPGG